MLPENKYKVWGRFKTTLRGVKIYKAVVVNQERKLRSLRGFSRTATRCMAYGERVLERYQRLCDAALVKLEKGIEQ